MTVKYSLAHLTVLGTTPIELIEIAADAGYDYASVRMTAVAPGEQIASMAGDRAMTRRVSKRLADTGIEVLDVELARLGPDDEPEQYRPMLEAAGTIGARHVIGQLPDPDRIRAGERFARLCDLAHDVGLTVELEFPSWDETRDLLGAAAVVRAADRPNAGILIDTLHFARSGSTLAQLSSLPAAWFRFVQVCDAPSDVPSTVEGVIRTARSARSLPGYGELPLNDLLQHVPAETYSLEVPNDVLRGELGTPEYARLVLATAREVITGNGLSAMAK